MTNCDEHFKREKVVSFNGMEGGEEGQCGRNILIRNALEINIGGRCTAPVGRGERIRIETPGGGGYGIPPTN
eukprot:CAMPEP_0184859788 /NCGR_PEP_ID=MMETSP0580-20130426/4787_1 /TAXON_ID=1118495 /ORGANISM="Dactyliosolen fragilissimus" /LENGTH=71 /DNA_ID=CAMNT_0027356629 /DNA_START=66 /DNA_END=282 /DNA_ORIENTATION=-